MFHNHKKNVKTPNYNYVYMVHGVCVCVKISVLVKLLTILIIYTAMTCENIP